MSSSHILRRPNRHIGKACFWTDRRTMRCLAFCVHVRVVVVHSLWIFFTSSLNVGLNEGMGRVGSSSHRFVSKRSSR